MEGDSSPSSSTSLISSSAIMNYENDQQNLEIQALKPMIEEMKEKLSKMRERIAQKVDVQDAKTVEKDAVAEIETDSLQIYPSSLKNFEDENERIDQEIEAMEPLMNEIKEENAHMLDSILRHIEDQDTKIRQMESEAQEKECQILELEETNSKLFDPHDFVTVQEFDSTKMSDWRPFLLQDKTLLINRLTYNGQKWLDEGHAEVRFDDFGCQIYVQSLLIIKSLPTAEFPTLVNRLHPNSFWKLHLEDLTVSFADFKNLVAKGDIKHLSIKEVTVRNEDQSFVSADLLLNEVPNIEHFNYTFKNGEKMDEIAEKFGQLQQFPKLCDFSLYNIQEGFDLETFGQIIQTNATEDGQCSLGFKVTKETFAEMERIKEEIVSTLPSSFCFKIFNDEI